MELRDYIGDTPLVALTKVNPRPDVKLVAKLEFLNPSGSIKDRIVNHILSTAEQNGSLRNGGLVVEATSGNTGASLAMLASERGYKVLLTAPDKVSIEKINTLQALGAQVEICPSNVPPEDPQHYTNVAKKIAQSSPDNFLLDQYNTPHNPRAHYLSTGPEIWRQTDGAVTHFVAGGSTGGTITGVSSYLKTKSSQIRSVMVDPVGSIYHQYHATGRVDPSLITPYYLEGIGEDHVTGAIDFAFIDEVCTVSDEQAFRTCHLLAKSEGILSGGSGGANIWASLQLVEKVPARSCVVTVIPDSGTKYLSKIYNSDWLKKNVGIDL